MRGRSSAGGWTLARTLFLSLILCGSGVNGCAGDEPGLGTQIGAVTAGAGPTTINIRAKIDGRSRLILRGSTAQWEHLDFAAPGRLFGSNLPTRINGASWFPVWPDIPDSDNRFCACLSDLFTSVTPGIPQTSAEVTLDVVEGRSRIEIIEVPRPDNGFRLVVEFDDNAFGADAFYEVNLQIAPGFRVAELSLSDVTPTDLCTGASETTALTYLSVGDHDLFGPNDYFDGYTAIYGTVEVQGAEDDELSDLILEILGPDGAPIARAGLARDSRSDVRQILVGVPFGPDRRVQITNPKLLFEVSPSISLVLAQGAVDEFGFRVRATSRRGEEAFLASEVRARRLVPFPFLDSAPFATRYGSPNRCGTQIVDTWDDAKLGGDSWIRPAVRDALVAFSQLDDGIRWGDMSNMNGGSFAAGGHSEHRDGTRVDGQLKGVYLGGAVKKPAAARIVKLLNSPFGARVQRILVAPRTEQYEAFWEQVDSLTLANGRPANEILRPDNNHNDHFHLVF
jgi:hypothetical protein